MQFVVYDKHDGSILLIKKGGTGKVTLDAARAMFAGKDVGVWRIGDRVLSVKSNRIALDDKGEPRGIIVYEGTSEFEIENFGDKSINPHKIVYKGVFLDHGGYANMNREIALRLSARDDVDLRIEIVPSGKQVDNMTFEKLHYLSRKTVSNAGAVNIVGFTPMQTDVSNYNVFFTMMETQTLHPDFARVCNNYADAIITPTQWNKDVFIKGGIKKPIHVVPLGVNIETYKPGVPKLPITCRELPSGQKTDKFPSFNYITLFGWSYRKGIDVLLKSYCDQFTSKDDVGFIICSRYMGSSDRKNQRIVERDILGFMQGYADPPRVYYYGQNTDIDVMPNLMANGDCFLWGSRGEGFALPVCLLPKTLIETSCGQFKNIEDIKSGENLIDMCGNKNFVLSTMNREIDEKIYVVKSSYCKEIKCTKEHPFMAVKRKSRYDFRKDLSSRIKEIPISNLSKGDFLVYPISDGAVSEYDEIDLTKYNIKSSIYSNFGKRSKFSWKKLSKQIDEHYSSVARAVLGKDHISDNKRKIILDKLKNIGFIYEEEKRNIPKKIKIQEDFMEFLGFYLSEGSTNNNHQVFLASHREEKEYQKRECDAIRKFFGIEPSLSYDGNRGIVSFYLKNSKNLFSEFGVSARTKNIPNYIMKYKSKLLIPMVRGIFYGDGSISGNNVTISSCSLTMLYQIRKILLNMNIISGIQDGGKNRRDQYTLYIAREHANEFLKLMKMSYRVSQSRLGSAGWISNGYFYSTIRMKNEEVYCGRVYNLDTDGNNTYIAGGVANHNCEAGAMEIPVISTFNSAMTDYLTEENSFLVHTDRFITAPRNITCISPYYVGQLFPELGKEAIKSFGLRMREVFDNYPLAQKKGKYFASEIREKYNWDVCAENVLGVLRKLKEAKE